MRINKDYHCPVNVVHDLRRLFAVQFIGRFTANDKSPFRKAGGVTRGFFCHFQHWGKRIFLPISPKNIVTNSHTEQSEICLHGQKSFIFSLTLLISDLKGILLFGLILFLPGCIQKENISSENQNFPENYPVLYPKFRMWPAPALNIVSRFNPPSLLWPAVQKKGTRYDIRLSRDTSFQDTETFHYENIPRAVYNPHSRLAEGTWFWQYRVNGTQWSELNSFRITEESSDFVSPPVEKFWSAISATHPRVLIDKKDLENFRNEVRTSPDALSIINHANEALRERLPEESDGLSRIIGNADYQKDKLAQNASLELCNKIYTNIDTWCKAYLITSDEKYARQAVIWALKASFWDHEGITSLSDFGDSRCMVAMALVFDTFWDYLAMEEKAALLKAVSYRAERFFKTWENFIEPKLLSAHVWQYMLHYFLQTAIALYGENEDASRWIEYVYELWLARAPVMGEFQGGWLEGASYFRINMETLLDLPMIIKTHTGFDFIQKHPWYKENPWWMIYSFPPGSSSDGFGDDVERIFEPGQEYLAYADALSRLTGNRAVAWYAVQIGLGTGLKVSNCDMLRWFRMKYLRNSELPEPENPMEWPSAKAFTDIGLTNMHSNLLSAEKDIMVSFRSSPFGAYGHFLADQNTFNILAGGKRLFYHSGYKVAMDDPHRQLWYKHTRGHNGILIDGNGQSFDVDAYGWIARFISGRSLSYTVGDASQAYSSKSEKLDSGVKKFRRHLLFLYPETILIYDELEADHPVHWSWLIHSPQKITIDSLKYEFSCTLGNFESTGKIFASRPLRWSLADTFAVPVTNWTQRVDDEGNLVHYEDNQWHLTVRSREKTSNMRFLSIITISGDNKSDIQVIEDVIPGKNLRSGKWMIRFETDKDKPSLLEAWRNDKQAVFSSSGKVTLNGKSYRGKVPGSSILVELKEGKTVLIESSDQIPEIVKSIPSKSLLSRENGK